MDNKEIYEPKRMGCLKITHEMLGVLLGIGYGRIRFIENDNNPGMLQIFHDDENIGGVFSIAEGQVCPETALHREHFLENHAKRLIEAGWTVEPPEKEKADD